MAYAVAFTRALVALGASLLPAMFLCGWGLRCRRRGNRVSQAVAAPTNLYLNLLKKQMLSN